MNTFGSIWIHLGTFGYIWAHVDTFGPARPPRPPARPPAPARLHKATVKGLVPWAYTSLSCKGFRGVVLKKGSVVRTFIRILRSCKISEEVDVLSKVFDGFWQISMVSDGFLWISMDSKGYLCTPRDIDRSR